MATLDSIQPSEESSLKDRFSRLRRVEQVVFSLVVLVWYIYPVLLAISLGNIDLPFPTSVAYCLQELYFWISFVSLL